jgi:predicted nucleic acid-binding protein
MSFGIVSMNYKASVSRPLSSATLRILASGRGFGRFPMSRIFWDTNLFIYLLEDSPRFADSVEDLHRRMLERNDRLFTSAMTVGEVLVKPRSMGNRALAERYRSFLAGPHITVSSFDLGAAEAYAGIRQDRAIDPADAIQLACAATAEVDLFITNDGRLTRRSVPGVKFFISSLSEAPI